MDKKKLTQLYLKHNGKVSDKWALYLSEYDRLLTGYRELAVNILEIGVQNGGSLEIWSVYFPNAKTIVGCDINPDCSRLKYVDSRISVLVSDINLDSSENKILEYSPVYDIIIDDGSHMSSDIIKSFCRYFPHLSEGGIFIVEDLHCSYWLEFEGGLFNPHSSISFFKLLSDMVNYEHWGIAKSRKDLLAVISEKYGVIFKDEMLDKVHSVEFINSMCVVRKFDSTKNSLGRRVVAGHDAIVDKMVLAKKSTALDCYDQSGNLWSTCSFLPDKEDISLRERLGQTWIELNNIKNSRTWRWGSKIAGLVRVLFPPDSIRRKIIRALIK